MGVPVGVEAAGGAGVEAAAGWLPVRVEAAGSAGVAVAGGPGVVSRAEVDGVAAASAG